MAESGSTPRGRVPPFVWGSFERNTGTWTPYSTAENEAIEANFVSGQPSADVPSCFNAVVHFNRNPEPDQHHYQMTPSVGNKPPGFRSVLRGEVGQRVTLHWWESDYTGTAAMWRLDLPPAAHHTQEVTVEAPADAQGAPEYVWQWCDLTGRAIENAVEMNWHSYAEEHGEEIEQAWSQRSPLELVIGLTGYSIGGWNGIYGTQKNNTTGCERQVRRGRFAIEQSTPEAYREDSCALCTELFTDTPQWPIRRTPCGHAFHYTCLQHILRRGGQQNRCPMCRQSLAGMSIGDGSTTSATAARPPVDTDDQDFRAQMYQQWLDNQRYSSR